MQRSFIILSVAATAILCGGNVAADAQGLRGSYAFSTTMMCLYASGGFNAIQQALGTTNTETNSLTGVVTFKPDGTGTLTQSAMSLDIPPTVGFPPSASSSEGSASVTYQVTGDTIIMAIPTTFNGKILSGPRAGQTFTVAGEPRLPGFIALGDRTLNATDTTPVVETITFSDGTVLKRICHRSGTSIKVP